jgi:DNA-binding MarR family transcriptional regulator|tara:strand:- start:2092 stop:2535 length:444 start_codon:yes stop_codon:yes gene_type:complete
MEEVQGMSDVAEKWGANVAKRGFSQTPNYLLNLNQFVDEDAKLTPLELLILVQLVGSWWKKDEPPFPSMKLLATRCGTSERQVQRAINRLAQLGLIERKKRRAKGIIASNVYDLTPLAELLEKVVAKVYPPENPRKPYKKPEDKDAP